jgi:hypothetical protein
MGAAGAIPFGQLQTEATLGSPSMCAFRANLCPTLIQLFLGRVHSPRDSGLPVQPQPQYIVLEASKPRFEAYDVVGGDGGGIGRELVIESTGDLFFFS